MKVGLRKLVMFNVREVVSEAREEGDKLIVGQKVELDRGGLGGSVLVPRSVKVLYGRGAIDTVIRKVNESDI